MFGIKNIEFVNPELLLLLLLIPAVAAWFFVKKKDVVESEIFQQAKPRITNKLYSKLAGGIRALWFKREINKHYVKYFY